MANELPDIQDSKPAILLPIKEVGVENVQVPFKLQTRDGSDIQLMANVSMRTNLNATTKGISMSRLIRTLRKYLDRPLKQVMIRNILIDLMKNVGSTECNMRFDFKLPLNRKSILSDYEFPVYHDCRFEGRLKKCMSTYQFEFFQGVIVQYASYCPCSAELSKDLMNKGSMGFPHAQRSFAHMMIEGEQGAYIWLEDIIGCVEQGIKTLPYPIIKRVDEQAIAEIAANNPMFVEDAIRQISVELNLLPANDWIVKCIHEESIHTSEAIAVNWKGISGGFDYKFFL